MESLTRLQWQLQQWRENPQNKIAQHEGGDLSPFLLQIGGKNGYKRSKNIP